MKKYRATVAVLFVILSATTAAAQELPIDRVTGLVVDKGLQDVKENCTVCHTGRFIVVNGGDKKFWMYKVRLMQKAYGLWSLKEEAKNRIINYLAKHYSHKTDVSLEQE